LEKVYRNSPIYIVGKIEVYLSGGGEVDVIPRREVLMKVVAQAIPTSAIGIFTIFGVIPFDLALN